MTTTLNPQTPTTTKTPAGSEVVTVLPPPTEGPKAIDHMAAATVLDSPLIRKTNAQSSSAVSPDALDPSLKPFANANLPAVTGPTDYTDIYFYADVLDDIEKIRLAQESRLITLKRDGDHGKAILPSKLTLFDDVEEGLKAVEAEPVKALVKAVKESPLGPYVASVPMLGEKTVGRLLKEIGDPAWNYQQNRPRQLRELYAYCGMHVVPSGGDTQSDFDNQSFNGVAPRRKTGQQSNWSSQARSKLWVMADVMVKGCALDCTLVHDRKDGREHNNRSAYRGLYEQSKLKYQSATHDVDCLGCRNNEKGPFTDGTVGSLLAPAHVEARARRIVMKAILRDLFEAAQQVSSPPILYLAEPLTTCGGEEV